MRPLEGFTVLDLTRVLSGPYCTMLLADMGARVIKIEQPGRGDETRAWGPPFVAGESAYFLSINRNKESVTLDFKTFRTTDRNLRFAALGGFFGVAIAEPITRSPSVRYGFYIAKPLDWTSGTVDGVVNIDPQTEVRLISTAQLAAA